jgi:hypothetical protein
MDSGLAEGELAACCKGCPCLDLFLMARMPFTLKEMMRMAAFYVRSLTDFNFIFYKKFIDMAATKENHIPPHIQKYFNTYGYNKSLPLNIYFQNQNKRITRQKRLNRLEKMQNAIQSTINTLPNSNNKKRYISNLTTLQELPNAKNQEYALLQLKKAILLKQEQNRVQQTPENKEINKLCENLPKNIDKLKDKDTKIFNSYNTSIKRTIPLDNATKQTVLDALKTGVTQVCNVQDIRSSTKLNQLQLFNTEIQRYKTSLNGGRRRTHRKRRTQKK